MENNFSNLNSEVSILAAILNCGKEAMNKVEELNVKNTDFFDPRHTLIYNALYSLYKDNKDITLNSLIDVLKGQDLLKKIGDIDYLFEINEAFVSLNLIESDVSILKDNSIKRVLSKVGNEINKIIVDAKNIDISNKLKDVEDLVLNITRSREVGGLKFSKEIVDSTNKIISDNSKNTGTTGVTTGYQRLDRVTSGFQKGDLIILAARPSVGKTAFALNLLDRAARKIKNGSFVIFSLEMLAEKLYMRMLSFKSNVPLEQIKTGKGLDENDGWAKLSRASQELSQELIYVDDTSNITVNTILSKCRKLKRDNNLQLVIIDYLQLIIGDSKNENRQLEVSEISRRLKAMAMELNIPVLALSQLSRQADGSEPRLSHLRESGSLEQDADVVMFLHRLQKADDETNTDFEKIKLIIAKHRNGETLDLPFVFEKNINSFKEEAFTNE